MNALIEARELTKKFGNKVALNAVSFMINQGDSIALVGPNGAGKSTLMSLICGFLRPTSGDVMINGRPRSTNDATNIIGALPQDALFNPAQSIGEQLVFLARLQGFSAAEAVDEAKRVLQTVRLETSYNARPTTLSHGMAKRVSIAQAMIGKPPIIILDEPTAGLDPETARHIRQLLQHLRQSTTLIVSSHNLDELEDLCHRTFLLELGRLTEVDHKTTSRIDYLTLEIEHADLEVFRDWLNEQKAVVSVETKDPRTLIIAYDTEQTDSIDIQVIETLNQNGWTYRSILRGRKLEDQLFSS
ncbi:MAG: ABC transporter ATP-binding protein [Bradymonadia bacterium]